MRGGRRNTHRPRRRRRSRHRPRSAPAPVAHARQWNSSAARGSTCNFAALAPVEVGVEHEALRPVRLQQHDARGRAGRIADGGERHRGGSGSRAASAPSNRRVKTERASATVRPLRYCRARWRTARTDGPPVSATPNPSSPRCWTMRWPWTPRVRHRRGSGHRQVHALGASGLRRAGRGLRNGGAVHRRFLPRSARTPGASPRHAPAAGHARARRAATTWRWPSIPSMRCGRPRGEVAALRQDRRPAPAAVGGTKARGADPGSGHQGRFWCCSKAGSRRSRRSATRN